MKINDKILSLPPYISTSWKNIISLHKQFENGREILRITLVNGSSIDVPGLDSNALRAIFEAHERHLDHEANAHAVTGPMGMPIEGGAYMSMPMPFPFDPSMGNVMQHDQTKADSPDLPQELLEKIKAIVNALDIEGGDQLPKPEPHCNCAHCQVMRAFHNEEKEKLSEEIEVSDEDLTFSDWVITEDKSSENLFKVTHPLNAKEQYSVFLGTPVGCTCGQTNCEHVRAVLNS